ncbi:MAG TPA: hypothetical protein VFC99_18310, partial [Acidimicrobiia bacterium]|nr:hypothetical protein [Acidimicrobiia bacterium]
MSSPILKPAPVDVVPAAAVESIITETQRDLVARDEERVAAEAAADAAERAATGRATDPAFHAWVATHVDRFAQTLRDEHEAEMRSLLEAAQRRARACVERAQVDADVLLSYAQALGGRGGAAPAPVPTAPGAPATPIGTTASTAAPEAEALPPLVWRPSETHVETPPPPAPPAFTAPDPVVAPPAPVVVPPAPPVVVTPPAPVVVTPPAPVVVPPAPPPADLPTDETPAVAAEPAEASPPAGDVPVATLVDTAEPPPPPA